MAPAVALPPVGGIPRTGRVLYLNTQQSHASLKGLRMIVHDGGGAQIAAIRLADIGQLSAVGNVQLTTQLLCVLAVRGVPISYLTVRGRLRCLASGPGVGSSALRRALYVASSNERLTVSRSLVVAKVHNQRVLLRRLGANPAALAPLRQQALQCTELSSLRGVEGAASRDYFKSFAGLLTANTGLPPFAGRNRRPPLDPANALLSFTYSLLARDMTTVILACGLDPAVGLYHTERTGRPSLAIDLMEPFRPVIADSVVLTLVNNRRIVPQHFEQKGKACLLTETGRTVLLHEYERRMTTVVTDTASGRRGDYRCMLVFEVEKLTRYLQGKAPSYTP
jgi:CRISPR-associated protein Cas1